VLGLVGANGIGARVKFLVIFLGKSTALQMLSGKLIPNLGNFEKPPEWKEILKYFGGSEL